MANKDIVVQIQMYFYKLAIINSHGCLYCQHKENHNMLAD